MIFAQPLFVVKEKGKEVNFGLPIERPPMLNDRKVQYVDAAATVLGVATFLVTWKKVKLNY